MTEYTVTGFSWQWTGQGDNEERINYTTPEFTFEDADGFFEYEVVSEGEHDDFDTISISGLDGLLIGGTPITGLPVDQAEFGVVEWDGNTTYILGFTDSSYEEGRYSYFVAVGGDPLAPSSLEEFEQMELTITDFGGAPDSGPYAPNTPISLENLPGLVAALNPVEGDSTSETLIGTDDADLITAEAGDDVILAGAGDDVIIGGAGLDKMDGGAGADTFVFAAGSEIDAMFGFVAGEDLLQIDSSTGVTSLNQLAGLVSVQGGHTVMDFGGGDIAVLVGVSNPYDLVDSIEFV